MSITQEEMFQKCASLGEESVREHLNSNLWSSMQKRAHAKEWLLQLDKSREASTALNQEEREHKLIAAAEESNRIAQESNTISESAIVEARTANRRALIAIGVALIVAITQAWPWLEQLIN